MKAISALFISNSIMLRSTAKKLFIGGVNGFIARILTRAHLNVFWGNLMLTLNKSAGFLEDAQFRTCLKTIEGSHLYDAYKAPGSIAWRLHTLVWAAKEAAKLPGDFVECGVFKGDFSWVVATMTDFAKLPKQYYLYDSFAGFSDSISSAEDFPDAKPGWYGYAHALYSDESLYPSVQQRFAPFGNVRVIKGFVPESFAQAMPESIAFLHLDLNSAAAEKAALEVLFDRVVRGGYVLFDDYGWFAARKQKDAIDAFFAPRGYHVLELPTGQGMVIKQ